MTPFEAGLGSLVDLDKGDFIGRQALSAADRRNRTWGLKCAGGIARRGNTLRLGGTSAGRVTSSAWSPYLQCAIAIVRLDDPAAGPGTLLDVDCTDGHTHTGEVCELPFYDRAGDIPRGALRACPRYQAVTDHPKRNPTTRVNSWSRTTCRAPHRAARYGLPWSALSGGL